MSITEGLSTNFTELKERQAASKAKASMQIFRSTAISANQDIQALVDEFGSFGTLDAEAKAALVATWNVIKATVTALENEDIVELLDWKP